MSCDTGEDVGQPGLRIDAIRHLAVLSKQTFGGTIDEALACQECFDSGEGVSYPRIFFSSI